MWSWNEPQRAAASGVKSIQTCWIDLWWRWCLTCSIEKRWLTSRCGARIAFSLWNRKGLIWKSSNNFKFKLHAGSVVCFRQDYFVIDRSLPFQSCIQYLYIPHKYDHFCSLIAKKPRMVICVNQDGVEASKRQSKKQRVTSSHWILILLSEMTHHSCSCSSGSFSNPSWLSYTYSDLQTYTKKQEESDWSYHLKRTHLQTGLDTLHSRHMVGMLNSCSSVPSLYAELIAANRLLALASYLTYSDESQSSHLTLSKNVNVDFSPSKALNPFRGLLASHGEWLRVRACKGLKCYIFEQHSTLGQHITLPWWHPNTLCTAEGFHLYVFIPTDLTVFQALALQNESKIGKHLFWQNTVNKQN